MQVVIHLPTFEAGLHKEERTKYRLLKDIEQELVASSPWYGERDGVGDMVVVVYIMDTESITLSNCQTCLPSDCG